MKDFEVFYNYYEFIKNENLRINISLNAQYINFQHFQFQQNIPLTIKFCIERDIYVHLASIAEACLGYLLYTKGETVYKEKYFDWKSNYMIDDFEICTVKVKNEPKEYGRDTTFNELIELAKNKKHLKKELIDKIDSLRAKRNKIHFTNINHTQNTVDDIVIIKPKEIEIAKTTLLDLYDELRKL